MKKLYKGVIPFKQHIKGHIYQMDWVDSYSKDVIWKENEIFRAKIEIDSYSRGRSAANWDVVISEVDNTNEEYAKFLEGCKATIFMTDMLDIIKRNNLFCGKSVFIRMAFCKRGANYGLCEVEE